LGTGALGGSSTDPAGVGRRRLRDLGHARAHGRAPSAERVCDRPYTPAEANLTGDALRRVRLSAILARAHAELAGHAELAEIAQRFAWPDAPSSRERDALTEIAAEAAAGRPKRGRPGLGDAHYARIAHAYLQKQAEGHGRGILNALAEQERRPRQTVRDWVAGARKRGFLTPGTQGRAGALPGPRLADFPQVLVSNAT